MKITTGIMIGQAVVSGLLGLALFLTNNSLQSTKIELGKARSSSDFNFKNAENWKKLFQQSDTEKAGIVQQNNDFINSLLDANRGAIEASRAMAVSNAGRIGQLGTAISQFKATEKSEVCEVRLANIERTLDLYWETTHAK